MGLCLVMIKPDAVQAGNVGKIITILEDQKYQIHLCRGMYLTYEQACEFYKEHKGKDFFERNVCFISSGSILVLLVSEINKSLSCKETIKRLRDIAGNTDPKKATAWTIRGRYGTELPKNAVHISDSEKSFERECKFFQHLEEIGKEYKSCWR